MPTPSRSLLRLVAVATTLAAVGLGPAAPASAAPSGTTAAGSPTLGALNERYNLTRLQLDTAEATLEATRARLDATRSRVEGLQQLVRARSAALYEGAAAGGVAAVLDGASVNELGRRTQYVAAAARPDEALLRRLHRTLERLDTEQRDATMARDKLRAQAETVASARRKLMAEAAAAKNTTPADGAGPVGTPRAMLVASSGSNARTGPAPSATLATGSGTAPVPAGPTRPPAAPPSSHPAPAPPAPSSKAAIAVAFAYKQLGKPYVFAAAGPNAFDCSGLTMAAWRAAGVSMAHYSGSQAAEFPHVSWSQLRPGDILVFYTDYSHVGLYIGNGQMIHAPKTGDVVKIASAWRENFQFGVRPG